jgi:hypothetical protein
MDPDVSRQIQGYPTVTSTEGIQSAGAVHLEGAELGQVASHPFKVLL